MNNTRAIRRLCTQLLQLLTFKTEPNRHKESDPIICSVTEQYSSFWTNIGLNIWYKIGHSVYDGNMIGHRGFRCIHFISYIILYRHQNTVSLPLVLIRGNTIWLCWPLILLEWMPCISQFSGLFGLQRVRARLKQPAVRTIDGCIKNVDNDCVVVFQFSVECRIV